MNAHAFEPRPSNSRSPRRWIGVVAMGVVLGALALATQPNRPDPSAQTGIATLKPTPARAGARSPTPVAEPSFADSSEVGGWSPVRYQLDWPGAPRPEPAAAPVLIELVRGDDAHWDPSERRWEGVEHVDATGDGIPDAAWLDIVKVGAGWGGIASFGVELAAAMPMPLPSPEDRWMAYGIVLDTNHDGRPDVRLGVDNMPSGDHRAWRTDYRRGVTAWKAGPSYGYLDQGLPSGIGNDTWYPGEGEGSPARALFRYSLQPGEEQATFYAWASLIEDGLLIGTDFAPDAGWLVFDDGDLALLGNHWDIEAVTSPFGEASVADWFVMRATFGADGVFTVDPCGEIRALAAVDDTTIRLRDIEMKPRTPCPGEMRPIDQVVRAIVAAPVIQYTLERGVLTLRAGDYSIRLIGTTEPL